VRYVIPSPAGAAGVLLLVLASPAAAHKRHHHHHHKPKDVKVQLLALNDFHGNLQTTTTGGIRPPTESGVHVQDHDEQVPRRRRR
jgi:hypothetical protein